MNAYPWFKRGVVGLLAITAVMAQALAASDEPLKQPGHWVQDYTHRTPDSGVLFGTLPNGLRYAIRHNTTPTDGVAMRLRIGSGSLVERDDERGLAHFLEHMAFRGSQHVADGEVVRMLERQGLKFGPDTNASTGHEETVYMFNFPKADEQALDTGLTLFEEIAEHLTLDQKLIDAERGVVLSEERLSDSPGYKSTKANFGNLFADTLVPERWPIGSVDTIKAATHQKLERYYRQNYRPDNATIIVVGNIDPKAIEAQIKRRFSSWRVSVSPEPVKAQVPHPKASVVEFVEPGAPDTLNLYYIRPVDRRAETEAVDSERLLGVLAATVLNLRYGDRASKPHSPFLSAGVGVDDDVLGVAALTSLSVRAEPAQVTDALNAVVEEQRRLVKDGVTAAEFERVKTIFKTSLDAMVEASSTRQNTALADELLKDVNADEITQSPQQERDWFTAELAKIRLADFNAAIARIFEGAGPVMFRSAQSDPLGQEKLSQALHAAYARGVAKADVQAALSWPYSQFGASGAVIKREEDAELGATTLHFRNGVRLIVKRTAFEKDQIHVSVNFGNGRQAIEEERLPSLWAIGMTPIGGTAKLSAGDITRYVQETGKILSGTLSADTDSFYWNGRTRPADLNVQLELLTAYFTDAGFRPEMAEKFKAQLPMIDGQVETSAGAIFGRAFEELVGGGDHRYGSSFKRDDLKRANVEDFKAMLAPALNGPVEVVMVGDVTESAAIDAVAHTFGALKPFTGKAMDVARIKQFNPKLTPTVNVTHRGRPDQAFIGVVWPLPDHRAQPSLLYPMTVAIGVLNQRLIDTVREKLGLTYSPNASGFSSYKVRDMGYFSAVIETPVANFESFKTLLNGQINALAQTPISEDELQRAKRPIVEGRLKNRENNAYWVSELTHWARNPEFKKDILANVDGINAVTAQQVQAFFAQYLNSQPATVLTVVGAGSSGAPSPH